MGYTTEFEGSITIEPPLNGKEIEYLNKFSETRRMNRHNGPYYLGQGDFGMDSESDIINPNAPPEGQPGLWCQWVPCANGEFLEWDQGEKFYYATEWMQYIIDHFFGSKPIAKQVNEHFGFLQGHTLNGTIYAHGEETADIWKIVVTDNAVKEVRARVVYDDEK